MVTAEEIPEACLSEQVSNNVLTYDAVTNFSRAVKGASQLFVTVSEDTTPCFVASSRSEARGASRGAWSSGQRRAASAYREKQPSR